jgi:double-stranded uracil-DNA glycosylase
MNIPPTLSDLICDGLDVVFVGINPSLYSVAQGHYFARKTNRFWPCFSRSVLSAAARQALRVDRLEPMHDAALTQYGFGFTDVAKRPSARAGELTPAELSAGVVDLLAKLQRYAPRVACFHGLTGYRFVHRVLAPDDPAPALGLQRVVLGQTRLFVAPNPSPANAHFTPAQQTEWYDRLSGHLARP